METPNAETSLEEFDLALFAEGIDDFGFPRLGDQFPLNQDAPLLEETRQTAIEVVGRQVESGINDFGFLNPGDQVPPSQDAPILEETWQAANVVLGGAVELEGRKARDMQRKRSRSHNISEGLFIEQSVQSSDTREEAHAPLLEETRQTAVEVVGSQVETAANDWRSKKKMIDQRYRAKQKANKENLEEELKTHRQEITKLQSELEAANQKIEKLESKSTDQINYVKECSIEFKLDFPDEAAERKLKKKAAVYPGITSFKMDTQRKRMSLEGIDIDPFRLKNKLDKICNTEMVYFNMTSLKNKEDYEVKLVNSFAEYNPHPYPQLEEDTSESAHEFTPAPRFSFKNAAKIFFGILLLLLLALMGKLLGILTDNIIYRVFEL